MEVSPQNLMAYLETVINHISFNPEIGTIVSYFSPLKLTKNQYFVKEGEVCNYFCYVDSGILQHAIEVDGNEKTTYLAMKNTCTSSLKSFRGNIPSRKHIKALTDCRLWVISPKDFEFLMEHSQTFQAFYHNLIENQIYLIDDYRIDLLTLSPEERYQKLLSNDPKLVQQVPVRYLASFLGISARHMSRIRKNII